METVVVGMSGGVDSSVAALLLKKQGYRVIGLFMKNWEEDGFCQAQTDYEDMIEVCSQLEIPYYAVNFSKEYWDEVFAKCLLEYKAGYTPNPDILCNREIKFKLFLKKALQLGADYLATGHYCRKIFYSGDWMLGRGEDMDKDQSYFLYTIKSSILSRVLFPIGCMQKQKVRELASKMGLATAEKRDSTGICFIGKRNFKEFLSRYLPREPGDFVTSSGQVVGKHDGIAYYTIGQRKGLKLGGAGEAWYVVAKDPVANTILVERGDANPLLFRTDLYATEITWVGPEPKFPLYCSAKVRYRAEDAPCTLYKEGEKIRVQFEQPQKAITSRQSVVFYYNTFCLGGGMIE
jgi:tRNA-uridine 2-sulfurtransferase